FVDIEIPNFFTPNGDAENDTWSIQNMDGFPEMTVNVLDRYGRIITTVSPNGQREWDGLYNGKPLPTGDYWYVIKLNGEKDDREFVGHFTLFR
ncbi:MAG: T9SS type B sorting domain-containing protein, partial [Flavobacteriaceae bacterium]